MARWLRPIGWTAAALLLLALPQWPDAYYVALRIVTTIAAAALACHAATQGPRWPAAVFVAVGVLFNPLVPFHLSRPVWLALDVLCAVMFIAYPYIRERRLLVM